MNFGTQGYVTMHRVSQTIKEEKLNYKIPKGSLYELYSPYGLDLPLECNGVMEY